MVSLLHGFLVEFFVFFVVECGLVGALPGLEDCKVLQEFNHELA